MIKIDNVKKMNFDSILIDSFWNTGDEKELKMHHIHAYPAKFPAFITTKTLEFAKKNKSTPKVIADVFCGCGTVAFEAKRNNIDFWGCDINPIATLIARAKSRKYQQVKLQKYLDSIVGVFKQMDTTKNFYDAANERLKYWYSHDNYNNLFCLKTAINDTIPKYSYYRLFFLCAFSNILKSTSRWLTKSIKPQIDPDKKPADVISTFEEQCRFMMKANEENDVSGNSKTEIVTANFLDTVGKRPKVDMIITSPPYVTSYEYADLHQLSSLWLDFVEDYKYLRKGSIGSLYHVYNFDKELKRLNDTGSNIVFRLLNQQKSKARSVAKYFLDMQQVIKACYKMLSKNGIALFVIGNTEYKNVRINNAKHLAESLQQSGFNEIFVTKRKISKKILTPYRDNLGRFTTDGNGRKVYSEEFILIGRK
jgi:methylase of polypeptide subunit release factors